MNSLQERIGQEWKNAMKMRDPKKDVLSLIRTELKNMAISQRTDGNSGTSVEDDVAILVLQRMAKQRGDAIEQFQKGNRPDLVDKEKFELTVIQEFLPMSMTGEEIESLVATVVRELGAKSVRDLGKVMAELMSRAKGRATGANLQTSARRHLAG